MFLYLNCFQPRCAGYQNIGLFDHKYTILYVNMTKQPNLSCYVRYFYGHLLFIHQDVSFIRHFFRGRILAEVSSGQKTHHNRCNIKSYDEKNPTATQLMTPSPPSPKKNEFTYLCPKHACFRVHDNDFEYQVTS